MVHLAGESIAGRWTTAKKERIRDQPGPGNRNDWFRPCPRCGRPPPALLCASAVGFYGDTGDRIVDETAPRGRGFLAEVCEAWEAEAARAADAGIRTRLPSPGDGAGCPRAGRWPRCSLPFRMGLGGPVGNGRQLMSWITLADAVHAIQHVMANGGLQGPVNLAAPYPMTNRTFAKALGSALHRPARLPLPAVAVRALLGEMGSTLLLGSTGADAIGADQVRIQVCVTSDRQGPGGCARELSGAGGDVHAPGRRGLSPDKQVGDVAHVTDQHEGPFALDTVGSATASWETGRWPRRSSRPGPPN